MRHPSLVMGALVLSLVAPSLGLAAEKGLAAGPEGASAGSAKAGLAVDEVVFSTAIKARSPAGAADTFPSDIYSVYCFTRLSGTRSPSSIKHVWYRGGVQQGVVALTVKSLPWRTWSEMEMRKEWKGDWRVDVVASDGAVLASKHFLLK
jgi:Protein of unknown function (DUF2914)